MLRDPSVHARSRMSPYSPSRGSHPPLDVLARRGARSRGVQRSGLVGLVPTGEAFGLPSGGAALHVDDLAVAQRQHLEALVPLPVFSDPLRRADDLVVAYLRELRLYLEPVLAPLLDLKRQDLTGLVRASSGGCVLPPEVTVGHPPPLGVVRQQ